MPQAIAVARGVIDYKALEASFKACLVTATSEVSDRAQGDGASEIGGQPVGGGLRLDRDLERLVGELRRLNLAQCEMMKRTDADTVASPQPTALIDNEYISVAVAEAKRRVEGGTSACQTGQGDP